MLSPPLLPPFTHIVNGCEVATIYMVDLILPDGAG